ncbi:MAG: hypothetical protein CVU44_08885 [Chloroflexi bacterium HGW-Chloroflexi-6]|nr:MAG: hypothetical protein CVU44_08885 [Chloroflexi bacterium HGW-Chloroflexi-6]
MIRILAFIFSLVSAALLVLAFVLADLLWPAVLLGLFFAYLTYSFLRLASWVNTAGFVAIFVFVGFGILGGYQSSDQTINFYLLLFSVLFSLAGWDLADFDARLRSSDSVDLPHSIRVRHYVRLGLALLTGLILALLAYHWKLSLQFGWLTILALLGAIGLGFMIYMLLNNQGQDS